jgi:hypothetical protein
MVVRNVGKAFPLNQEDKVTKTTPAILVERIIAQVTVIVEVEQDYGSQAVFLE